MAVATFARTWANWLTGPPSGEGQLRLISGCGKYRHHAGRIETDDVRRRTDVLVRRSARLFSRTDEDVRPTKCLSAPREKDNAGKSTLDRRSPARGRQSLRGRAGWREFLPSLSGLDGDQPTVYRTILCGFQESRLSSRPATDRLAAGAGDRRRVGQLSHLHALEGCRPVPLSENRQPVLSSVLGLCSKTLNSR